MSVALDLLYRVGDDPRTPEALSAGFDNALVMLYRLLFCLHAEDRGLLPADNVHYAAYSLRTQRDALARDRAAGRVFSSRSDDKFNDLRALFRIVDRGDPALGVNEYDGGLFSPAAHPWLHGRAVPDDLMAVALDLLYRVGDDQVDYRDLSVRHLGTIFEQLLANQLAEGPDRRLRLEAAVGRKRTGAFFTPEHIVGDIVERTLAPLFDQCSRRAAKAGTRALNELLDLHVLDPAMGSGHFLVGAAAYLARRIANDPSYDGDLTLAELQGLVAERCLYGVDGRAGVDGAPRPASRRAICNSTNPSFALASAGEWTTTDGGRLGARKASTCTSNPSSAWPRRCSGSRSRPTQPARRTSTTSASTGSCRVTARPGSSPCSRS